MAKILILGAYGMLGHKLFQKMNDQQEFEVYGTCRKLEDFPIIDNSKMIPDVDAGKIETVDAVITKIRPDYIINCIGLIKQRNNAEMAVPAITINALFPHQLAALAKKHRSRLIHFSTDCVFSGDKGNYDKNDFSDAHDFYGRTKFLGELHDNHCLTIRSSIIGPELERHAGLLDWFRLQKDKEVNGYQKAIWSGITTIEMAKLLIFVIKNQPELSELWQVAMSPISKYDLLNKINERMGLNIVIIPDSSLVCDRSLNGSAFLERSGFKLPSWDAMIEELAKDCEYYRL